MPYSEIHEKIRLSVYDEMTEKVDLPFQFMRRVRTAFYKNPERLIAVSRVFDIQYSALLFQVGLYDEFS